MAALPLHAQILFGTLVNMYNEAVDKGRLSHPEVLAFMEGVVLRGLRPAYAAAGMRRGDLESFQEIVQARDKGLGVDTSIYPVKGGMLYTQSTDFFAPLRDVISPEEATRVHLRPKCELFGMEYELRSHIWKGASQSEYLIRPA